MALKKKLSPAAHAASMMKAISSAQDSAMKAFSDWGKSAQKAVVTSEKHLAATAKQVNRLQARASNALKRVQKAKAKQVKAIANNARKLVLADLAAARAALKSARDSHATAKAAHKIFQLVEKSVANGIKAAEKAAKPKKLRRRIKKLVA
jgi:molecular chaperone GrpE (heat shock protein)